MMSTTTRTSPRLDEMDDAVADFEKVVALAEAGTPKLKSAQLSALAEMFGHLQDAAFVAHELHTGSADADTRAERAWSRTQAERIAEAVAQDVEEAKRYLRGGRRTSKKNPFRGLVAPEAVVVKGIVPPSRARILADEKPPEFATFRKTMQTIWAVISQPLLVGVVLGMFVIFIVFLVTGITATRSPEPVATDATKLATPKAEPTPTPTPTLTATPSKTPTNVQPSGVAGSLTNPLTALPDGTRVARGKAKLVADESNCGPGVFGCVEVAGRTGTGYVVYLTTETQHWGQWYEVDAARFDATELGEAFSGELSLSFSPGHIEYPVRKG